MVNISLRGGIMRLISNFSVLLIVLLVCSCNSSKQIKDIPDLMIEYESGLDNSEANNFVTYVKYGSASWAYGTQFQWRGFITDAPHPLEKTYNMPKLEMTDKIKISISYQPDYYTVKYWTENYIGDPQTNDQYYQTLDVNDGIITLPNKDLGYVFQVSAIWESVNGIKNIKGYANYVFFVLGK